MEALLLAAVIMAGAMWFPARNADTTIDAMIKDWEAQGRP